MTKLHEILAVETDKDGYFKKAVPEMIDLFKGKASRFQAHNRTLKLIGEETPEKIEAEKAESEYLAMVTTVPAELIYLSGVVVDYINILAQKDEANCNAKADVIIGGKTILRDIPATTLLSMESKLKQIRSIFEEIPTLQPGTKWNKDETMGNYVYVDTNPEVRAKTKANVMHKILVPPTDKHPAQIEKWTENSDIGYFTKVRWSGMLSVADKSTLLGRLDKLTQAIKQARQRANEQEVNTSIQIGEALFNYLYEGIA